MSSSLKQLKLIKQDTKFIVVGYVRQNENKLSLFCNVPSMIPYLCLLYYFHGEYFEKVGDDINISKDKRTITKVVESLKFKNTSYGQIWIDPKVPQIAKWKFMINKMLGPAQELIFNRLNEDCNHRLYECDYPNYAFDTNGATVIMDKNETNVRENREF